METGDRLNDCAKNEDAAPLVLRLYIAGRAPNSRLATANINRICEDYYQGKCEITVIDVLEDPHQAIRDGILVTPTLVKLEPGPRVKIIGNLSETKQVLEILGCEDMEA